MDLDAYRARAQAFATDLNRALITAEAAVRKAQKLGGGAAQGALWWVDRELQEVKRYKPRGGVKAIA